MAECRGASTTACSSVDNSAAGFSGWAAGAADDEDDGTANMVDFERPKNTTGAHEMRFEGF